MAFLSPLISTEPEWARAISSRIRLSAPVGSLYQWRWVKQICNDFCKARANFRLIWAAQNVTEKFYVGFRWAFFKYDVSSLRLSSQLKAQPSLATNKIKRHAPCCRQASSLSQIASARLNLIRDQQWPSAILFWVFDTIQQLRLPTSANIATLEVEHQRCYRC